MAPLARPMNQTAGTGRGVTGSALVAEGAGELVRRGGTPVLPRPAPVTCLSASSVLPAPRPGADQDQHHGWQRVPAWEEGGRGKRQPSLWRPLHRLPPHALPNTATAPRSRRQ